MSLVLLGYGLVFNGLRLMGKGLEIKVLNFFRLAIKLGLTLGLRLIRDKPSNKMNPKLEIKTKSKTLD